MASKFLKGSRQLKDVPDSSIDIGKPPAPPPPTVTFGRRTLSGRYISYSRDDLESELSSAEFSNYHVLPCECDFKICVDCPGCKEQYRSTDLDEVLGKDGNAKALSLSGAKMERRLSMMKSTKYDFDHNKWLFETKGTYGYGNAFWPAANDDGDERSGDGGSEQRKELIAKPWRPLTRKLKIPAAVLSP